jgi:hypothetical protein
MDVHFARHSVDDLSAAKLGLNWIAVHGESHVRQIALRQKAPRSNERRRLV